MQVKTDHGIKLEGFYRGKVIQHLSAGKCKIFIPGVYPDSCVNNPNTIPDAEQAAPLFGGTNKGNGTFSYPNIGTIVWCFFMNGDQNFPVYFAATLGGELPTDSVDQGFNVVRDNVSPDDDKTKDTTMNGLDSYTHMINCGDSRILIRETGQIQIQCIKKPTEEEGEEGEETKSVIFIDEDGKITIESTSAIQISTPALKIDAKDNLEINTTVMKIRANNEIQISTPQLASVNSNSFTVISPSINMDASQGKFTARGATHSPLFLT